MISKPVSPTVHRVVMYPGPTVEPVEIPHGQLGGIALEHGLVVVVQVHPDGSMTRWVNVPCRIDHAPPSGLVAPPSGLRIT